MDSSRVAIDAGGTFTDCVFVRGGKLRILKILSTPHNPAQAIAEAVERVARQVGEEGSRPLDLTCGTTVGTNALLERRGGRVALVTTAGFEDVIEIGRQARPRLYDFFVQRPETLVPRERRFGFRERITAEGRALLHPSQAEFNRIVRLVRKCRPDAVAVCVLFSFANPAHERKLARRLRASGFQVSASQEIFPEFREFERTATTVINAYLLPVMGNYLSEIARLANPEQFPKSRQSRRGPRVRVMQSSGGIISAATAAHEPVRTILSGPAGGVLGAQHVAELAGFRKIISFDMGGTSTDVALIDGPLRTTNESEVAGLPVAVPMLDIHTVGAGGGSLARFDRGGALRVGPESAGADPGPICYGRGTKPTVTDAHLVLGRIVPRGFLGGEFRLDLSRTREWMARALGPMGSLETFAQGILDVVQTNMEKAIRVISIERGYDPRDYTLVAFGGAGGLHACGLAAALEIPRVLIPKFPGGLSALGILRADAVKDFSKTIFLSVDSEPQARRELQRHFSAIERQAVRDMRQEGFVPRQIGIERLLDMRYIGQAFELTVPAGRGFARSFHRAHEKRYGYSDPKRAVEVVNIRARAIGLTPKPELSRLRTGGNDSRVAIMEKRDVSFAGKRLATPVYDRSRLLADNRLRGPAIVAEYSATTVIEPGWQGHVDAYGNLILERAQ
ncbi:MAG TPA: hydantoinase/oxoprolinase family protein [Candidatus Acidoferrales bacterium]|nr:hydantoinase/oxoprolinase family protein [Candidatus Acidoferrales bacterium]